MGYFSGLAAEYVPYDHDHSVTPPEKQLLWRLEELEERLKELMTQKTGRRDDGVCFCEDDLRYVLPEHFSSLYDVQKAIDLAVRDLHDRYDIHVGEETEKPADDEITCIQMTFMDLRFQGVPLSAA